MGTAGATVEDTSATYEIHLQDAPPDTLVARFAPTEMCRVRAQTVFVRRVVSQDELASLLDRVLSMGLVLDEVHELRITPGTRAIGGQGGEPRSRQRAYEVRVAGRVDGPMLRLLRWDHRHVPELARLSLEGTPDDVHEFLGACFSLRLGVDRVRRLTPVNERPSRSAG
jgi:hypothetical protein